MSIRFFEFRLVCFVLACLFGTSSVKAAKKEAVWQNDLKSKLENEIKKARIQNSDISVLVKTGEGEDEKIIYALNADKLMSPASVTKLATGAAALAAFPPGTTFKTKLASAADIEKGILKGDLYMVGDGDPSFVSETLWFLVNVFTRTGVTTIEGDIAVDDSKFDHLRYDPSRSPERVDRAYDAPVGAMSFNWNSVNVFVRPGKKVGDEAEVFIDPPNDYIRLIGKVTTASGGSKDGLNVSRVEAKEFWGDVISVSGKIGINLKEAVVFKNVTSPDLWSGANLKAFLKQRGIEVKGKIKNAKVPPSARVLAEADGKTMELILGDMNKFSNNFVAEMIAKNLAATRKTPGTVAEAMKAIDDYLLSLKIPRDQFKLENPSGLSRENRLSSTALVRILEEMKHNFQYQPEFLMSLPIAGVDGTLKSRLKDKKSMRWVRAKTGSINNVVSLAGYAGQKQGYVMSFSFIYNGSSDEGSIRALFDKMAAALVTAAD